MIDTDPPDWALQCLTTNLPQGRIQARRVTQAGSFATKRLAAALDRDADALLNLGQVRRAELLAHRAEAMRAEVAR